MKTLRVLSICLTLSLFTFVSKAQSTDACKVNYKELQGTYTGECKNGLASGQGEAKGIHSYTGTFKNGMPNGKGIYYTSAQVYHTGSFQDGLKEGKGESHYLTPGAPDSIVKGYWSGDIFRGKRYVTYEEDGAYKFDHFDLRPSSGSGNTLTIELSTTTGSPNGITSLGGGKGVILTVTDMFSLNNTVIRKLSNYSGGLKTSVTYHLNSFPAHLHVTLSDGQKFELNLFKSADWNLRISENK